MLTHTGARAGVPAAPRRVSGRPARRTTAALALGTLVWALSGCAPAATPEVTATPTQAPTTDPATPTPAPSPTSSPSPQPTAAPDPFAAPITFPACAELVSAEESRELSGLENFTLFDDSVSTALTQQATDMIFGPATLAALGAADPLVRCSWGIPSSSASVTLLLGVLPEAARSEFRAALDASDFAPDTAGDVDRYTLVTPGGISTVIQRNSFVGDLWVAEVGTAGGEFATPAIERIRVANTP